MTAKSKILGVMTAAVVAAALLSQSAVAQTVIKIGVITTYSGPLASPGISMDRGLSLYAKLHASDLPPGVTVEILRRDDTGPNPDTAKRLAQELVTRDQVNFLAGAVYSPNGFAIASIAAEAKVPYVDMNAAAAPITRTPYVVRDSFTLWQVAYPMGLWAAKHGMKQAIVAVSDYAPGNDAAGGFTKGFTEGGGQVVDTVKFPLQNPDFAPFLQKIKDAKPQALFIFVPGGPQSTQMMKAYTDLGLKKAGITLVTTQDLAMDSELPNMGDAPLGVVNSGTYSVAATRPSNQAFLAAWTKEYGDKVIADFPAIQGWDGMAMMFDVIKKTGGKFDGDQAMAILSAYKTASSPRGSFSIDPDTHDIVQNIYIRRVEKRNGKLANIEFETFPNVKDIWKEMNPPKPQ
jgi:branched-chain amino acid transport system substrate-binding protein